MLIRRNGIFHGGNSGYGIGFTGSLQILFIAFKILDIIKWNWFWVLSPTWITILLVVILIAVMIYLKNK